MSGAQEEGEAAGVPEALRLRRRLMLAVALVLALGLLALWWQRLAIADHFVQRALAARQVRATFHMTHLSLRSERLENLVLGDPARPDFTARAIEVDLGFGGLTPHVTAVRVEGGRLFGRVDAGGLHLGEIDKLRSTAAPGGETSFLPDIALTLRDARARLETPAGPVGLALNGSGNLRDGFSGQAAAVVRKARYAGCAAPLASAWMAVETVNGAPHLAGPVRADALACGGNVVAKLALLADVRLDPAQGQISGTVKGNAEAARGGGAIVAEPTLYLQFGAGAGSAQGHAAIDLTALRRGEIHAGPAHVEGDWTWRAGASGAVASSSEKGAAGAMPSGFGATARVDAQQVRAVDPATLAGLTRGLEGTPVAPLAARLMRGLAGLQRDNRLTSRFSIAQQGAGAHLALSALRLEGKGGEHLALSDASRVAMDWPSRQMRLDGGLSGGGGDLPDFALHLRASGGRGYAGQMFVQPYAAGGARLALDTVRFVAQPNGGSRLVTRLRFDGPLPEGMIRGLDLPLVADRTASGDWTVNPGCGAVGFDQLRLGALSLDPQRLSLCPAEGGALLTVRGGRLSGGAVVRGAVFSGRLGENPLRFSAGSAAYALSGNDLALTDAELLLGDRAAPVRLAATRLDGRLAGEGLGGEASGIEGRIATVPLLVRDGTAHWGYANGALSLRGDMLVRDTAAPARFEPVRSSDFALRMANGRITAGGTIHAPANPRTLAQVSIVHDLARGAGRADFAVKGLRFDKGLQPDQLTMLTKSVIANVDGTVDGSGSIRWRGDHVTSSGDFATAGMNLAAAFGPLEGLSGRIHFTDLLGLVSAPDQEVRLASVHPGVDVHDGVIHYALLPDQKVAIRDGSWPFAGGRLTLLPTVMDMSADKPRALTFRVVGLDAGAFIDLLALDNVSATGTFDGLLPMIFDAQGGRIVGGVLAARQQGMPPLIIDPAALRVEGASGLAIPCDAGRQAGHLAYVGQVSNENVGKAGRLAFDALKDLQYKCLTILMDGALDGEIVTQVLFNGVNRGELSSVPKVLAKKFIGLPFVFNVRISAPFRGLLNTAQSFVDPSLLLHDSAAARGAAEQGAGASSGDSGVAPRRGP